MIIVSSLDHSEEAFRRYAPQFVISILDDSDPTPPIFDTLPSENHLKLDRDCSRKDERESEEGRCALLIDLAERWRAAPSPKPSILIHCHKGVARSMAVAFILMCAIQPKRSEKEIAEQLRAAAPHADPNLMLISEADAILGRNDRMIEAILDLHPCCGTVDKPIVTLPLAA